MLDTASLQNMRCLPSMRFTAKKSEDIQPDAHKHMLGRTSSESSCIVEQKTLQASE
jgi:hypothetical protein